MPGEGKYKMNNKCAVLTMTSGIKKKGILDRAHHLRIYIRGIYTVLKYMCISIEFIEKNQQANIIGTGSSGNDNIAHTLLQ